MGSSGVTAFVSGSGASQCSRPVRLNGLPPEERGRV